MSALVTLAEALVPSALVAVLGYVASTRAAKITAVSAQSAADATEDAERGRVEAQAYERARGIYESALRELERQAAGLRDQVTQLNAQLAQERNTSTDLRIQVSALEERIASMDRTISELRGQLATAAVDAAREVHRPGEEGA